MTESSTTGVSGNTDIGISRCLIDSELIGKISSSTSGKLRAGPLVEDVHDDSIELYVSVFGQDSSEEDPPVAEQ